MARYSYTGDFYVSPLGSDANSGTSPDAPFATIQAAFDAIGSDSNKTVIIGTGFYSEAVDTGVTTNSQRNIGVQGDGVVIIDGTGISDDATNAAMFKGYFKGGSSYIKNITFTNWHNALNDPQHNQNHMDTSIQDCVFINNSSTHGADIRYSEFHNCVFVNSPFLHDDNYFNTIWENCLFLGSGIGGANLGNGQFSSYGNSNQYWGKISDCVFVNPFTDEPWLALKLPKFGGQTIGQSFTMRISNTIFDHKSVISSTKYSTATGTERSDLTHPFTQSAAEFKNELDTYGTWLNYNGDPWTYGNYVQGQTIDFVTMSFFSDYTGSGDNSLGSTYPGFNTFGAPYSLTSDNDAYFNLGAHPLMKKVANLIPALNYTTLGSSPFHTAGGATWSNIVESGSGLVISSSTLISGTIESAVIDQGASKTIQDIQFNWTTNAGNQGVVSYYTASQGGFGTPFTYQLRYGDAADLSSNEYKIFPLNEIPYLDINGSGSGDVNFITGSTNAIKARYLQFKITLRNDWNGG